MSPVIDPLGLERCAVCGNAYIYDADPDATSAWRDAGQTGFVCKWCSAREPVFACAAEDVDESGGLR
jgi:hypothetical protein